LSDAIFGFLPQLVRNVVISEALTVEHDHLEKVSDSKLEMARLHFKVALCFWVARVPRNLDRVTVSDRLDTLGHFHLILGERITVLTNENLVIDGPDTELDPLDQVDWLIWELVDDLERRARLIGV